MHSDWENDVKYLCTVADKAAKQVGACFVPDQDLVKQFVSSSIGSHDMNENRFHPTVDEYLRD